jgi:BSD domain.
MASWFGNFKASEAMGKINEISSAVQQVSSRVQQSLPLDDQLLKKLTLRSEELVAEHNLIDTQERRKEAVRDSLSSLLPWETRDEAREILVEECKDAILGLASKGTTFTGPFGLPEGVKLMFVEDSGLEEASDESKMEADKKLQKMGKLPPLLDEFDLDAHVGLIERLFQVDKDLVRSHSLLLHAGKTEKIFWKNYFVSNTSANIKHDVKS